MYAYVMRPSTLPSSYHSFIVRTGPIDRAVLALVRAANRSNSGSLSSNGRSASSTVDIQELMNYMRSNNIDITDIVQTDALGGKIAKNDSGDLGLAGIFVESLLGRGESHLSPGCKVHKDCRGDRNYNYLGVPCQILHPQSVFCSLNNVRVFSKAFRQSLPFYVSIYAIPSIIFNKRRVLQHPKKWLQTTATNSLRSTVFLSSFVALYQAVVCAHRNLRLQEHKSLYWIAGMIASSSIFLENSSRRSELTIYCLPRALDSLMLILLDRRLVPQVPFLEVLVMCLCMGSLMSTFETVPEAIPSLLRSAISSTIAVKRDKMEKGIFERLEVPLDVAKEII